MRNYSSIFSGVLLTLFSVSVLAATVLPQEALPAKVQAEFNKRFLNATSVTAETKTHFGQELYLIAFKEVKEDKDADTRNIVYYRVNGHFYVNGDEIDTGKASIEMPAASYVNLKAAFNDYDIKEAILVVNPNGLGEEYDLVVNASSVLWHISLDRNGNITKKEAA
ncbi:MAG: hypothetical protein EXR80_05680 [Methylococcales bacterium]|nr:hypothetical protein [Methylococcales bacterium]